MLYEVITTDTGVFPPPTISRWPRGERAEPDCVWPIAEWPAKAIQSVIVAKSRKRSREVPILRSEVSGDIGGQKS